MPLKDLIADKSKITEELIESIIKPYVKYDPASKSIILLPEVTKLNNIKKVLIYLVSLKGWRFITEEPVPFEVKPKAIEKIGIRGGSLRPTLKSLKDQKIIVMKNGKYSIPDYNIVKVKEILEKENYTLSDDKHLKKKKTQKQKKSGVKSSSSMSKEEFESLINSEWFDTKRTINDIKEKLHEQGIIVPTTTLSPYLLRATKEKKLERKKEEINGKKIWAYSKK